MTKSKSSASSIVVPSTFMMHLTSGAQFSNAALVPLFPTTVILPPTIMQASL